MVSILPFFYLPLVYLLSAKDWFLRYSVTYIKIMIKPMNKSLEIVFDCQEQSLTFLEAQLQQAIQQGAQGVSILLASNYPHTEEALNGCLKRLSVPVSGAVFPELIYGNQYYDTAAIALLWFHEIKIHTFLGVSNLDSELYQRQTPIDGRAEHMTSLVFSNTKTRAAEAALDALYFRNGQGSHYAGAGAGYSESSRRPSIITNDGLVSDAMQITRLPYTQATRVGHGWSILSGPHLVTESEENRVATLDYQAIKPYFQQIIQTHYSKDLSALSFEEMMSLFPVGIQPYDEDMIVRDLLAYEAGEIQFIGDIPEFSNIYILTGEPESLLKYVEQHSAQFEANAQTDPSLSIIFSCVGRRRHMGNKSDQELNLLATSLQKSQQLIGVSSLGEIASNNVGLARLHSMSLVVSSLSL